MKSSLFKNYFIPAFICICLVTLAIGCKKDKIEVNEVREYSEVMQAPPTDLVAGAMQLTLKPDGTADIVPGGDISYRGTYKINGSTIKVKTPQNSGSYAFEILSETEIKNKEFGTLLKLKQ
jgi:hypothetical protein